MLIERYAMTSPERFRAYQQEAHARLVEDLGTCSCPDPEGVALIHGINALPGVVVYGWGSVLKKKSSWTLVLAYSGSDGIDSIRRLVGSLAQHPTDYQLNFIHKGVPNQPFVWLRACGLPVTDEAGDWHWDNLAYKCSRLDALQRDVQRLPTEHTTAPAQPDISECYAVADTQLFRRYRSTVEGTWLGVEGASDRLAAEPLPFLQDLNALPGITALWSCSEDGSGEWYVVLLYQTGEGLGIMNQLLEFVTREPERVRVEYYGNDWSAPRQHHLYQLPLAPRLNLRGTGMIGWQEHYEGFQGFVRKLAEKHRVEKPS